MLVNTSAHGIGNHQSKLNGCTETYQKLVPEIPKMLQTIMEGQELGVSTGCKDTFFITLADYFLTKINCKKIF